MGRRRYSTREYRHRGGIPGQLSALNARAFRLRHHFADQIEKELDARKRVRLLRDFRSELDDLIHLAQQLRLMVPLYAGPTRFDPQHGRYIPVTRAWARARHEAIERARKANLTKNLMITNTFKSKRSSTVKSEESAESAGQGERGDGGEIDD